MSLSSQSNLPKGADLSSLMDGELDASAVAGACGRWRADPSARATWHAYHLIGDVLRSEDLAFPAAQDAAFLDSFRARLAQEPVVLAPASVVSSTTTLRKRRTWMAPAAVAAGFLAVAGVLVVTQMSGGVPQTGPESGAVVAASPGMLPAMVMVEVAASSVAVSDPPAVMLNGQLVRDARLDEYLAAHKKFGGSSALGGPSGFLRNAAADGTAR